MAMNKKERAEFEEMCHERDLALALRFPTEPEPVPTAHLGVPWDGYVNGWFVYEHATPPMVEPGYVTGSFHTRGKHMTEERWATGKCSGRSQSAPPMYSTRLDALLALRHKVARNVAEMLAQLDREIENERGRLS